MFYYVSKYNTVGKMPFFGKKDKKESKKSTEDISSEDSPVVFFPVKPEYELLEEYWVKEPFSKVKIVRIEELGGQYAYFVEEVQMTEEERKAAQKLIDILSVELQPPESFEEDVRKHVIDEAHRLIKKYRSAMRGLGEESWEKVVYYIERDLLGYGPIDVLMNDWNLEDISCDGVNRAIYVWHRKYESIPTNIVFRDRDYLREFIIKLAHISGKHVSAAFPIVDAMLPGRHRLAATFGEEVSPRGSTFTIRKFRERPFSIIDLINSGNIDLWTAAYSWIMLENRMTLMITGTTAAGKTTLLNSLTSFFKPSFKIVTIEETAELNLPHENWVQLVSRESYGLGETKAGEISLYDLVRLSLRYRPDYIIVGEVRGAEAFVLFQAMATGHGGLSTMHADSIERAIRRLTSPPMNVSEAYIPSLNFVMLTERTILPSGGFGRRIRHVWEIEDYNKYREIVRWNPAQDNHEIVNPSYHLEKIAEHKGTTLKEILEELEKRQVYLLWLKTKGITDINEVSTHINRYYYFPEDAYNQAVKELEEAEISWRQLIKKYQREPARISPILPSHRTRITASLQNYAASTSRSENIPPPRKEQAIKPQTTPQTPASDKLVISEFTEEKKSILRTLLMIGGEADHKTLINESGVSTSAFWRIVKELRENNLIASTLIYLDGKPAIGFKLTDLGKKFAQQLS